MKKFKRVSRGIYRRILLLVYKPKKEWEKLYIDNLFDFGVFGINGGIKKRTEILKQKINNDVLLKNHWVLKKYIEFDFRLSWLLFGTEDEDYLLCNTWKKSWKYRMHCFTRQRLNFVKPLLNTANCYILDNKSKFNEWWAEFLGRAVCSFPECTYEEFFQKFKPSQKVIIKPTFGGGGKNIIVKNLSNDLNEDYAQLRTQGYLVVEEYYFQKGFLHEVNPSTLNTIRVHTFRLDDNIKVWEAYCRAGLANSIVDNMHQGGIEYPIDIHSGQLFPGKSYFNSTMYDYHPSTGAHVTGEFVPNWEQVVDICKKAHMLAPEGLDWIGWDVGVSDNEIILIEGNRGPACARPVDSRDDIWGRMKDFLNKREELQIKKC